MVEIEILYTKRISVRDLWMHFYVSKNLRCRMTVYLDPLLGFVIKLSLSLAKIKKGGYYMKQSEKIENDAGRFLDGEEEMRLGDKLWLILLSSMLICPWRIALATTRIVAISGYSSSGGKDLTVPAFMLSELNRWHNYGFYLFLLSIDEGITGYRDDSLETVKQNEVQYGLPLKVVSYKDLYGWTMDDSEDDRTEK
ncbi:hypothetical protein GIB67_008911 [Kingdonia uniflora]|uniref:Uncharacterized protein n=1 Tax=Kingdonia uniflora TaxID=39325 RepID=A0A7J7LVI1_9MAGN|nr:hypothetical protein GIB67_008911 [Kingdonia uniflora]